MRLDAPIEVPREFGSALPPVASESPRTTDEVAGGETATARPLTEVANTGWPPTRFRFEYRPPRPAAAQNLPHATAIRQGRLLTPAFSPQGNVD
jgi:hypothetical protein